MRNRIKCLNCGEILESTHRHDFRMCDCENRTFIDGGKDYRRMGGINLDLIKVLEDEN